MPNYLSGRFQPETDYAFSCNHALSHVMLLTVLNSDSLLNIIAKCNMNAIILDIIAYDSTYIAFGYKINNI